MSSGLFSNQMRGKVVRGLLWKGGSQFARQLLRIIVAVILARLPLRTTTGSPGW